jgi:hypothetical protein
MAHKSPDQVCRFRCRDRPQLQPQLAALHRLYFHCAIGNRFGSWCNKLHKCRRRGRGTFAFRPVLILHSLPQATILQAQGPRRRIYSVALGQFRSRCPQGLGQALMTWLCTPELFKSAAQLLQITGSVGCFGYHLAPGLLALARPYQETSSHFTQACRKLTYSHVSSEENNKVFGRSQSFVPGAPTNIQFMFKNAKEYAATGGWGFAQFKHGKPDGGASLNTCFPCHNQVKARDLIFARYAP